MQQEHDQRATRQPDEWLIVHALRRTWWHIDEGWEAVDRTHRRRWLVTMAIGVVALLAFTTLLVFVTRSLDERGALTWERDFVLDFERRAPFSFGWAIWIESPGNGVILWPLVIGAASFAAWRRRTLLALTIALGFVLLDVAVLTGWTMWKRARPDLIAGGVASSAESFSAFPSGHVSQTIVVYGILAALWARATHVRAEKFLAWLLLAVVTLAVAAGRVRLGAHWPSDIIGGAVLGLFWLMILLRAVREERHGRH